MVPQLTHVALPTLDAYAAHGETASHQRGFSGILSFAGADGWLVFCGLRLAWIRAGGPALDLAI